MSIYEAFHSEFYMEDITDEDYAYYKKVLKELFLKNFRDYYDLYVQCDTLLLADVFENFRNKCIDIYELYQTIDSAFLYCSKIKKKIYNYSLYVDVQ